MLKVKNAGKKNKSPSKSPKGPIVKAKTITKKNDQSKILKAKDGPKLVEKVVTKTKDLVKLQKATSDLPQKKVIDPEVLAAKKEKRKQKKKFKAAAAKAAKSGLVKEETVATAEAKNTEKKPQTNGTVAAAGVDLKLSKKAKKLLKKKSAAVKEDVSPAKAAATDTEKGTENPEANGTTTDTAAAGVALKLSKKAKKMKKKESAPVKEKIPVSLLTPDKTIFVGNLPVNTKRVQIMKLFKPYEPIAIRIRSASGKIIYKYKKRKESGSLNAYITLKDADSAAKALELNGVEFKSNHLRVTKTDGAETDVDTKRMVFVGNLKYSANDEKLRQIFSSCGEIDYVRTLQDPDDAGCKGVAFVCFKEPDAVGLALELKGTILDDRPINVERYSTKKLGAKNKRDAENQKLGSKAPHKGNSMQKGKFPQKSKPPQKGKSPQKQDDNSKKTGAVNEKKKKSEFRGAKSQLEKKKQKKKIPTGMKKLAMKIAPRSDD